MSISTDLSQSRMLASLCQLATSHKAQQEDTLQDMGLSLKWAAGCNTNGNPKQRGQQQISPSSKADVDSALMTHLEC